MAVTSKPLSLPELLARAEALIERLEPAEALSEMRAGALLVDLRSETDRAREGVVPGALPVPRTVLEWRFDPEGEWRSPHACGLDDRVVLLCDHGCSSLLAAATLVELGYRRAADVIGGFEAWRAAGLPVASYVPRARAPGEPAGLAGPDSAG